MKRLPLWLFLLTASLAIGEVSEARQQELVTNLSMDVYLDVFAYPAEEKRYIKEWILNVGKRKPGRFEDTFDKQLLQLGHDQTIEKYGQALSAGSSHAYVSDSRQPRLIRYYEPRLSIDEPAWVTQAGDTTAFRSSMLAAGGILHLLSQSLDLPGEVRVGARDLLAQINDLASDKPKARKGLKEARSIVRQWWTENKQAVVDERFSEVKPGKVHSFILEEQPKPEPIGPAESVAKRPESRGESSSAPRAAQEVEEVPAESSNWYWVVPAVCVALAVGMFAAFRKKV